MERNEPTTGEIIHELTALLPPMTNYAERIKRLCSDGAFVCYHGGDTAAKTAYSDMHKLTNGFLIVRSMIGGSTFINGGLLYE